MRNLAVLIIGILFIISGTRQGKGEPVETGQWSGERTIAMEETSGCMNRYNYQPVAAINQMEMWQEDSLDPEMSARLVSQDNFDTIINNKQVKLYTLTNKAGCIAQFTNLGGRWVSMWVPDGNGNMTDVVLGFNSPGEYLKAGEPYHGAIVGRVCGRINNARFTLNGNTYDLAHNDGFGEPEKNHLHGGVEGFHRKVWDAELFRNDKEEQGITFSYTSPDGEEGFPGELKVMVSYTLTGNNEIRVEYSATTDKPTIVNLTNHVYFNLNGEGNGNILNHTLKVYADKYIEGDKELIPTGKLVPVDNSPFDYRDFSSMGKGIGQKHSQIFEGMGYAIAMVIKEQNSKELVKVAEIKADLSSIKLEVLSDQASLQLYNAWLFDGRDKGKSGKPYHASGGFIMETQGYPDAPNNKHFPPVQLKPGDQYTHTTIFRFSVH